MKLRQAKKVLLRWNTDRRYRQASRESTVTAADRRWFRRLAANARTMRQFKAALSLKPDYALARRNLELAEQRISMQRQSK